MDRLLVLKAISDKTRMKILALLLKHNYCVRALARNLGLAEATVSQHLKVLREAGLLTGEKRGYFMHYDVERKVLRELAADIEALAATEREVCTPAVGSCEPSEEANCHVEGKCSDETKEFCHGKHHGEEGGRHGNCNCHKP